MPRHRYDRQAWRCAYRIQDTLHLTRQAMRHDQVRWAQPVVDQMPQIARSSTQLTRAVSHTRLNTAPHILAERLLRQLQTTTRDMQVLSGQLAADMCSPSVPLRDLLGELDQLESEFGQWRFNAATSELSVTTEPIELEGIELGRFEIQLGLGQPITTLITGLFRVHALEPSPAASNQEVTHPHISGEALCVGDSGPELIRSLRFGRVCDFSDDQEHPADLQPRLAVCQPR